MIDPANLPEVESDETLARYVLHSSHIRTGDLTVKPDAFMPPANRELSVTRHLSATEEELWEVGERVAATTGRTLYGRGDIGVAVCLAQRLGVRAELVPGNPNHAHVLNWPAEKPAQKIIALEIAATALFVPKK